MAMVFSFTELPNSRLKMAFAFLMSLRVPMTATGMTTAEIMARKGSCTTATVTSAMSERASRPMDVMTRFSASRADAAPRRIAW